MKNKANKTNKILLLLLLILDMAGFTIIFPLLPTIFEHYFSNNLPIDAWFFNLQDTIKLFLPISTPQDLMIAYAGILTSIYSLTQFLIAPLWGRLSDDVGRKPILLVTTFGYALSYVWWLSSASFTAFCFSRILSGLMAGNLGVATAAIVDMGTEKSRNADMGLIGAAFGLGFVFGPLLGAFTLKYAHIYSALSEYLSLQSNPFAPAAFIAFLLSIISFGLNVTFFKESYIPPNKKKRKSGLSILFGARIPVFRNALFLMILNLYLTGVLIMASFQLSLSFFYKWEFKLDSWQVSLVFSLVGVLMMLGQGGLVRISSKFFSEKKQLLFAYLFMPIPLILFGISAPNLVYSLISLSCFILCSSLVQPALASFCSKIHAKDKQGEALSIFRSMSSLGRAIGPMIGAQMYWLVGSRNFYIVTAFLLLGLSLFLIKVKEPKERRNYVE